MNDNTYLITSKQLIFIIIGATIGVGILTLTSSVARESQQDAWISILIGALPLIIGVFTLHLIGNKFPDHTFAEYSEIILGKWPGKLLALTFSVYCLLFSAIVTRIFVNILKIFLFPATPIWALSALIIFISAYLASKDIRVLGRVNELMFFESIVLVAFIFGAMPQIDLSFFQPVGDAGISNILKGTYQTLFALLGIEILLVIYPLVQNKKEIVKASLTAVIIITLIYLLVAFVTLGIFGPNVTEKIRFGLMVLLKTYDAPVIERAEFFFIIFWVFVAFRPVANMYFASRYTAEKVLNINSPGWVTLVLFPVILIVSLIPDNFEQALSISVIIGYIGLGFIIIVPIILWFIAMMRGVGGKKLA